MRSWIRLFAAASLWVVATGTATAQAPSEQPNFPSRTIRMIVPFPPGGPADLIARFVAQKMNEDWGQPVIIENRPGGNTGIGAQAVARSAPDGHTLLVAMDVTMVLNPLVFATLPYDPGKDFATITLLTKNFSLVVTRADGPKTVNELIAKAKANPGKLNMGAGTLPSRLGALAFAKAAGIDVQLIPYKGSPEIVQGLLSGSIDFALDSTASSLPQIQAGKFRALAKYSSRAFPQMPELQSLSAASGLSGVDEAGTWIGLLAPAGTPSPILDKIHREVVKAFNDPALAEKIERAGLFTATATPAEFDAYIRSERERWSKVLKENKDIPLD
jgi:tripartite-type tricarboxylate transporter receptor subunit TctC